MPVSPGNADASADERFMRVALDLAARGQGRVEPNPMVGCLLVKQGEVIGRGYHEAFGQHHAEVNALQSIRNADPTDATAYVTLEPCCHHGKTPPCSRALIDARVARVVVAMQDPFPPVDGGGLKQLTEAGIETTVGVLAEEAACLNAPYLKRVTTGKPWVIAKWAMTADGRIATVTGESRWITGPSARAEVHRLRARVDAIGVGMGTVRSDDPLLTTRPADEALRLATRVVFCRHELPAADSKLARTASQVPLLLMVGRECSLDHIDTLTQLGTELHAVDSDDPIQIVHEALRELGTRGMTNVMIEGGADLLASFFESGQIDECHVYVGCKAVGGRDARGPIAGRGIEPMSEAQLFRCQSVQQFDHDVQIIYRKHHG